MNRKRLVVMAMLSIVTLSLLSCNNDNEPAKALPGIGISAPEDKSTFITGSDIRIQAFATDHNGPVARMDFYEGTNKLGEATLTPYEYVWPKVNAGDYTISVTTIDDNGSEMNSTSITIKVVDPEK